MNHESYLYDDVDTELYQTNGYGGTDADVTNAETYTNDIDLTEKTGAAVDFQFDASGAVDDLELALYKRRDDNWDDAEIAVWSVTVSSDGSEDTYHFTIDASYGPGHYRFGMASSGATNTFDIDVEMRAYRRTEEIG